MLGKKLTLGDAAAAAIGWKSGDFRRADRLIEIEKRGGHDLLMIEIRPRAKAKAVLVRPARQSPA